MNRIKKLTGLVTAAVITFGAAVIDVIPNTGTEIRAEAASVSYPIQEFRLGIGDTNRNVNIAGTENGSNLNSWVTNGLKNEKWYLNYISDGIYEIVNAQTGYVITNQNGVGVIAADQDGSNQRWKIIGVDKDHEGYYLNYKIVSNANSNLALTFHADSNSLTAETYTGNLYQKFKLNCDGLEGFAANCTVSQGEKAGVIGGLLGKTVIVNNVSDFKTALDSTEPMTIVVNGNFDMQSEYHTRIRDYKTIVGSYSANTLQDCYLRTNNEYGNEGDEPSDNIIIRNIDFEAVNVEDRILVNIWSSRNIWIDHCTFNSKLVRDRDEVGKFIWINTPYDFYQDAKDRERSPDYITISYCTFTNRYWTVAYGTQNDETTRCRTTLMYNYWDEDVRRTPQIGNGNGHIYNNYFEGNDSGNDSGTAQIIGGDGSNIVSENCRFQSFENTYPYCICAGGGTDPYRDSGSYYAKTGSATPTPFPISPKVTSTWYPNKENYGYSLIDAYNTKGTDVKNFCLTYAGAFDSYSKIKYITDNDMAKFVTTTYPSPFQKEIEVGGQVVRTPAVMDTTLQYMFKNQNSGLYMEVDGAGTANGTNVQQWGATERQTHNTWKLIDAGDGYYYIRSRVGNGKSCYLDVYKKSAANGTNIDIYQKNDSDALKFRFYQNEDGSYVIATKVSDDASCIGVESDATSSGANVVEWECNGKSSQNWIAETDPTQDGTTMDETKCYQIKNVNSGLFMEVDGGKQENGANVQQWGASAPAAHNVWTLKSAGWGYYYLYSGIGDGRTYALTVDDAADGSNAYVNEKTGYSTQFFKFVDNEDGTYTLVTRASKDASAIEIVNAEVGSGANVQQWDLNGHNCQKWIVETVDYTVPAMTTTTAAVTTTTAATTRTTTTIVKTTTTEKETTTTHEITTVGVTTTHKAVNTETTTEMAATTTAATTTTTKIISSVVFGDVNLDNDVSLSDLVTFQKYLRGAILFNDQQMANANCDQTDEKVNDSDATVLMKFLIKILNQLPVTE